MVVQTITSDKRVEDVSGKTPLGSGNEFERRHPGPFQDASLRLWARLHIFVLGLRAYRSLEKVKKALGHFLHFRKQITGGNGKRKFVWKQGKVWFGPYIPPFPSKAFDKYILTELNRYVPHGLPVNAYQQVNFAITTKCPMRCEHCFEWDNLNIPETYSLGELKQIIGKLQQDGLAHIALSGGEPMTRFKEMVALIKSLSKDTQWWIYTSGFNLTPEKARQLKEAGTTGVLVSIDHFEPEVHNLFRGRQDAFLHASGAVRAVVEAGLMVVVTVCVTRSNANRDFLISHAKMAAGLGADFIQWLEPRAEGHYRNSDVMLQPGHISTLEELYVQLNHDPGFKNYPPIIYHGYHQRRIGCQAGGRISFYVDAVGMVHSCPFCHSHDFKIEDWLGLPTQDRGRVTPCQEFEAVQPLNNE